MARYIPGFQAPAEVLDESVWVVFDASGSVVRLRRAAALPVERGDVLRVGLDSLPCVFLGMFEGRPCYAAELPDGRVVADDEWEICPLRDLLGGLDEDEVALAGTARGLLHWETTHRYCGCCGARMASKADERAKVCPACGHTVFPRINPAVIVAVRRGDELLLGRNRRYRNRRMFSLVAGFVEVGESLEQTVRREVMEESGLTVCNIEYFGSQSWPFPSTLMVGFRAEYAGGEIQLHDQELIEAGWFSADALPEIPRPGSISRSLIDDFTGHAGTPG